MRANISPEEVAKHNSEDDCWIIIDDGVYDVTKFLVEHPGGKRVLLKKAGQDATKEFHSLHAPEVLGKYNPFLKVGTTSAGPVSSSTGDNFGTPIPYAEPYWYNADMKSPYYNQSHKEFRIVVRNFIESEVSPNLDAWENNMDYPRELHEIAYKAGGKGCLFFNYILFIKLIYLWYISVWRVLA